jgi:hypothetical protein
VCVNLEAKTHCILLPKFRSGIFRYLALRSLRWPPGNRLHALVRDLVRYHAIRVNDQYRVVFRFEGTDAYDVSCRDYH